VKLAPATRALIAHEVGWTMRNAAFLSLAVGVSGCSTTFPGALIAPDGQILRVENFVTFYAGRFSVSDGSLTCAGSYNPLSQPQTVKVAVRCNDGRTGIAIATRDTETSGGGKVTFSDGSDWTFVFGEAARNI
jgi:hypothetical protein